MNINDILKKILEIPDLVTNKHTHSNKSVIDKITQSLLDNWNSAYSHISDSVKHITGAERTTWNTVTNKVDKVSGKGLSANDYTTEEKNKLSGIANNANNYVHPATHSASMITQDATHRFVTDIEKTGWNDKYSKNEIDNKINQVITDLDWKESVATYSALSTTYPSPQDGWTVNVKDTDITYRWSGTAWISISANSIPLATSSTDGKMSKQDKIDHDDMVIKKHTHDNKSVLDGITSTLITAWNSAVTHISDTVKHITSAERTTWNTVTNKAEIVHTHTKSQITDFPTKLSQFNNDAGYITALDVDTSTNHVHSNKSTLDKITESNLTDWNNKLSKSGGTMSGTISWDGLTANKDLLYATGSTDWAKISYIINGSDNCELRNTIGDDVTTKFTWYGNSTNLMTLQPTGNATTISGADLSINGNITATNFNGTVNGFTLGKTVPANAVFTDTNTWRGVQDNLTSTATDQSLSANQGKVLKGLVDGKASTSHTHNNIVSRGVVNAETGTGGIAVGGLSMSQAYNGTSHPANYGNVLNLNGAGQGQLLIGWSGTSGGYASSFIRSKRDTNDAPWSSWAKIYTTLDKPSPSEIGLGNVDNTSDINKPISTATQNALNGKANSSHTHNYAGSSSAGGSANTAVKLATARTIALTGSVTGSVSFDGSGNVSMTTSEGNISFKQLGEVGNTTNWNTLTTAGCYKVQMSAWGASATYYSPNQYSSSIYNYGLLLVFKSAVSSEDRTVQIYIPHKDTTDTSSLIVTRMLNGTTWNSWKPIFKGITKSDIGLGNVDNTSDLNKPISTAMQSALDGKINSSEVSSGNTNVFGKIPRIGNDGVIDLGRYIDFHITNTSTNDNDIRLEATTTELKCTKPINANLNGNATTATKATQDSDGKQINTTYVKKGMTWNELEGV